MITEVTILVVEDDKGLNRLIQKTLQQAGFITHGVLNGNEAIAAASNNKDVIMLLDYKLPDRTGKEVIETLKEKECSVPFIIVTGHGDEKIAVEMMKMGARDYIVKSAGLKDILPHILKRVISDLTQEKKLARAESHLKLERNKLINILDTMADGVYIENQQHEIEYANPSLQQDFGDYRGRQCNEYFIQNNDSCCPWCKTVDFGESLPTRLEWHSDRNDKTYDLINTPLHDPDGRFTVMGIFRDITEYKKARQEIDNRVKELEGFYEVAVGRELKMKELKEEVHRLQEEIRELQNRIQI